MARLREVFKLDEFDFSADIICVACLAKGVIGCEWFLVSGTLLFWPEYATITLCISPEWNCFRLTHCTRYGGSDKVVSQVRVVGVDFFCRWLILHALYCLAQSGCVRGSIVTSASGLSVLNLGIGRSKSS